MRIFFLNILIFFPAKNENPKSDVIKGGGWGYREKMTASD